jgi:CheY-like chemotaxis protein
VGRATILIADDDSANRESLARALDGYRLIVATSADEARARLGEPIDLVAAGFRLPGGIDLLRHCEGQLPSVKRLLVASWDDLPGLVKQRLGGLAQRVVQPTARPENLRRAVAEVLGDGVEEVSRAGVEETGAGELGFSQMDLLLRWTARRAAQVSGVVIRQLPAAGNDLQLQMVLPSGKGYERFREEVVEHWHGPVKPRDEPASPSARRHPVVALLGDLDERHELYARRVDGEVEMYAYLALLPWRREKRVTAALGICRQGFLEILRQLILDVHRFAVEEVAELPLPTIPSRAEATGPGQTVLEYDWVVTDSYVGADRRKAATPFLGRFSLFGRRRRIPSRAARTGDNFVDRLAPWVRWYALAYLILSLVDTALTLWCVRRGTVGELNPLLRPLVLHRPWLFLVVKNALSLAIFYLVARFHLFRIGKLVLAVTVGVFALLDLYWIWLLR